MAFLNPEEHDFLKTVSKINYVNPFLPERVQYEREALGSDFDESKANWNLLGDDPDFHLVNTKRIIERAYPILLSLQERLRQGVSATRGDLEIYEDTALFLLYNYYAQHFKERIIKPQKDQVYEFYKEFIHYWNLLFDIEGYALPKLNESPHIFACMFQVRRAFFYIFRAIMGRSSVASNLRASVWSSIFTHDMRRYRRSFFKCMGDFATLIIGPTGSGKELVATAIGYSRYIPFNPDTLTFKENFAETFFPISLSALPTTLVESELFGHRRGSFTGALDDRKGWLEICPDEGTVFLDEIGELDPLVQVKLLRVIQARTFQRIGSTQPLAFKGKIVTATHRNIHLAMEKGEFRHDLYYRLCSDIITTPSLHEQIRESADVLWDLVGYISLRVAGNEGKDLGEDVKSWIQENLGMEYTWPGNIRELEQCVRNVMIRREYHPTLHQPAVVDDDLILSFREGSLSLEDLSRLYCAQMYTRLGSYSKAARQLKIDRRTVKKYVDQKTELYAT